MGLWLRAAGRARRLRQDFLLHRLDQPDHQREQPVAVGQPTAGKYKTVVETRSIDINKVEITIYMQGWLGRGSGLPLSVYPPAKPRR